MPISGFTSLGWLALRERVCFVIQQSEFDSACSQEKIEMPRGFLHSWQLMSNLDFLKIFLSHVCKLVDQALDQKQRQTLHSAL